MAKLTRNDIRIAYKQASILGSSTSVQWNAEEALLSNKRSINKLKKKIRGRKKHLQRLSPAAQEKFWKEHGVNRPLLNTTKVSPTNEEAPF
jgi:hypothetical protein